MLPARNESPFSQKMIANVSLTVFLLRRRAPTNLIRGHTSILCKHDVIPLTGNSVHSRPTYGIIFWRTINVRPTIDLHHSIGQTFSPGMRISADYFEISPKLFFRKILIQKIAQGVGGGGLVECSEAHSSKLQIIKCMLARFVLFFTIFFSFV